MCLLELRMFKPEGHITFWRVLSSRQCVAQNTSCVFQNVSSTFARFIGEEKDDIRISQLNTSISKSRPKLSYCILSTKNASFCTRHYIYKALTVQISSAYFQIFIENRINSIETKKLKILCCSNKGCSSPRSISISQLNTLLCLHL